MHFILFKSVKGFLLTPVPVILQLCALVCFYFHSLTLTPSFPKNPGVLFTVAESPTAAPVAVLPPPNM